MDKVINKLKKDEITYKLGYNLYDNKVYPRIEIYKNNRLFSGGCWYYGSYYGSYVGFFYFDGLFSDNDGYTDTIKEMFTKLRQYNEIPQMIEEKFENIFIMYKLNDFKEI
jgi:hypothetical protein